MRVLRLVPLSLPMQAHAGYLPLRLEDVGRPVSRVSGQSVFLTGRRSLRRVIVAHARNQRRRRPYERRGPEVVSGPCDDDDQQQSGGQSLSSVAARCGEHLPWLVDATYRCTDRDALLILEQTLEHGRDSMQLALPQDTTEHEHHIPTRTQVTCSHRAAA